MAAPRALTTGIGSPVRADSSMVAVFEVTTPSTGMISPARTRSRSPIATRRDRHLLDLVVDATMGLARRAVDQRAQIVLGAGDRDILEHVAAGIHQRDHGAGERLAERQRRAHRHQRDRIDPQPAGQKIAHDRDRQSRHDGRGRQPSRRDRRGRPGRRRGRRCPPPIRSRRSRPGPTAGRAQMPSPDSVLTKLCKRLFAEKALAALEGNQARADRITATCKRE